VVGMAHGVLFLLYLLAVAHAAYDYRWSWRRIGLLTAAAFLPFGPFIADARLLRTVKV
jgi:integral membrane protein